MALALERRGLGVTSGMRATAGERYTPMATSSRASTMTKDTSLKGEGSAA